MRGVSPGFFFPFYKTRVFKNMFILNLFQLVAVDLRLQDKCVVLKSLECSLFEV